MGEKHPGGDLEPQGLKITQKDLLLQGLLETRLEEQQIANRRRGS